MGSISCQREMMDVTLNRELPQTARVLWVRRTFSAHFSVHIRLRRRKSACSPWSMALSTRTMRPSLMRIGQWKPHPKTVFFPCNARDEAHLFGLKVEILPVAFGRFLRGSIGSILASQTGAGSLERGAAETRAGAAEGRGAESSDGASEIRRERFAYIIYTYPREYHTFPLRAVRWCREAWCHFFADFKMP